METVREIETLWEMETGREMTTKGGGGVKGEALLRPAHPFLQQTLDIYFKTT